MEPGRQHLSASRIHLLTETDAAVGKSQCDEIGIGVLLPTIRGGQIALRAIGRARALEIVTDIQAGRRVPQSNHRYRMTAQRTEVAPVAIPKAGNLGRPDVHVLKVK